MLSVLVPRLMKAHEEYFVTDVDTTMTVGLAAYRIPTRAAFGKLRDIVRIDAGGKDHNLTKLNLEELNEKERALSGTPTNYYLKRNTVYLWPVPDAAETLRLSILRRPNRLVGAANTVVGIVSSFTSTTVTLTATKPTTITTSTPLDFIQANPQFDSLADDKTPTVASGTGLTFTAGDIPSGLAAGDFVCLAGEAPVVQLPVEMFYELAQRVARKLLAGTDGQSFDEAGEELAIVAEETAGAVEQRNEGEEDIVVANSFFP